MIEWIIMNKQETTTTKEKKKERVREISDKRVIILSPKQKKNRLSKRTSNNKIGRPKADYSITYWFKDMFRSHPDVKDKLGKAIIRKALEGDMIAIKLVWSYMDGLPQIKADITSDGQSLKGLIQLD